MKLTTLFPKKDNKPQLFALGETCFFQDVQYKCTEIKVQLWNNGTNVRTDYFFFKRDKDGEFPQ